MEQSDERMRQCWGTRQKGYAVTVAFGLLLPTSAAILSLRYQKEGAQGQFDIKRKGRRRLPEYTLEHMLYRGGGTHFSHQ